MCRSSEAAAVGAASVSGKGSEACIADVEQQEEHQNPADINSSNPGGEQTEPGKVDRDEGGARWKTIGDPRLPSQKEGRGALPHTCALPQLVPTLREGQRERPRPPKIDR